MTIRKEQIPREASENGVEQVLLPSNNNPNDAENNDTNNNNIINGNDSAARDATTTTTSNTSRINNGDGTTDIFYTANEHDENDDGTSSHERRKLQHWRQSPFAVGVVNVTWWDDRPRWWRRWCGNNDRKGSSSPPSSSYSTTADANANAVSAVATTSRRDIDESMYVSSIVCGCLGADRVGNMAVLAQSTETYQVETVDEETGQIRTETKQRPRLLWVIGPYWTVNMFLTWPLILGVSGYIGYRRIYQNHIAVIVTWSIGTSLLILSLCMISCRNPGILHRYAEPPSDTENWRWNDQAMTYRPPKARFDPETQVVVEGFDHTCPWTGTAIGSRNMFWFRIFICMVPIMIGYSAIIAAVSAGRFMMF